MGKLQPPLPPQPQPCPHLPQPQSAAKLAEAVTIKTVTPTTAALRIFFALITSMIPRYYLLSKVKANNFASSTSIASDYEIMMKPDAASDLDGFVEISLNSADLWLDYFEIWFELFSRFHPNY